MHEPRLSLAWAAPSRLRFAIIIVVACFHNPPGSRRRRKPIPAELAFLNKLGKPLSHHLRALDRNADPPGESGDEGVGSRSGARESIGSSPASFSARRRRRPFGPSSSPAATPEPVNPTARDFPWARSADRFELSSSDYEGHSLMDTDSRGKTIQLVPFLELSEYKSSEEVMKRALLVLQWQCNWHSRLADGRKMTRLAARIRRS